MHAWYSVGRSPRIIRPFSLVIQRAGDGNVKIRNGREAMRWNLAVSVEVRRIKLRLAVPAHPIPLLPAEVVVALSTPVPPAAKPHSHLGFFLLLPGLNLPSFLNNKHQHVVLFGPARTMADQTGRNNGKTDQERKRQEQATDRWNRLGLDRKMSRSEAADELWAELPHRVRQQRLAEGDSPLLCFDEC